MLTLRNPIIEEVSGGSRLGNLGYGKDIAKRVSDHIDPSLFTLRSILDLKSAVYLDGI
jgi:hypothetical protein